MDRGIDIAVFLKPGQGCEHRHVFQGRTLNVKKCNAVLLLGTELMVTQQSQGDELMFELDSDVAEDIMDAIDRLQYDNPCEDSESDQDHDPEVEAADSEALRNKILEKRAQRRVDFIANSSLERSRRERPPSLSLRESLECH